MPTQQDIPVYLFTGFLESGKTQFVNESVVSDQGFVNGDSILLLVCEEGIEEYDEEALEKKNIHVEKLEQEIDCSTRILQGLLDKHKAQRVLVEYNGMWMLNSFYQSMPENWAVYQEFCFVDATTFENYNNNMRSLMVDKFQSADLVIFNRFTDRMDEYAHHQQVRMISRRAQIAYEYTDGRISNDNYQDPLPFDLDAPVVEVKDTDFAQWYRDITEDPKKYVGKVIDVKGYTMVNRRFTPGTFAFGRQIMTCCAADIQYCSLIATCKPSQIPEARSWYQARFKVEYKFHKLYGQKGPILNIESLTKTEAPEQEVATFF